MASVQRKELLNVAGLAADTTGDAVDLEKPNTSIIFQQIVTGRTGGTYTTVVEHSSDGTNWYTLSSFTAVNAGAGATELEFPTTAILGKVRATCTFAAGGTANVLVTVHYE